MKILIYSEGRVGSHSLGKWLQKELKFPFIAESMEFDYENEDNFIRKIYFRPQYSVEDRKRLMSEAKPIKFECFDKIIRLYRKNTFDQSISNINTLHTKRFQHSEEKFDAYYEIDKEFCDNYYLDILGLMKSSEKNNTDLEKLNLGLFISYEEIFIENTGQKKLEEYLGFQSKTDIYDSRHKLRIPNLEMNLYLSNLIETHRKNIKLI